MHADLVSIYDETPRLKIRNRQDQNEHRKFSPCLPGGRPENSRHHRPTTASVEAKADPRCALRGLRPQGAAPQPHPRGDNAIRQDDSFATEDAYVTQDSGEGMIEREENLNPR